MNCCNCDAQAREDCLHLQAVGGRQSTGHLVFRLRHISNSEWHCLLLTLLVCGMRSCNAVGVAVPLPLSAVQLCNARILCLCLVRHRLSTLVVVAPCAQCITPNTQQSPHLSAGALQVCSMCCVVMPALCGVRRSRRLCLRVRCGGHGCLGIRNCLRCLA